MAYNTVDGHKENDDDPIFERCIHELPVQGESEIYKKRRLERNSKEEIGGGKEEGIGKEGGVGERRKEVEEEEGRRRGGKGKR